MKRGIIAWVFVLFCCCVTANAETCWDEHDGIMFFGENGKIGWYCDTGYRQEAVFDAVFPFVGEWAIVRQDEYWGVADRTGNFVVEPIWVRIRLSRQFTDDHLIFCYNENAAQIINVSAGNAVYQGDPAETFYGLENGIALVNLPGNGWRAVDISGQVSFEVEAVALYPCGNGYYNIFLTDGKMALLDQTGSILPNSVSQFCSAMDENRAVTWDTEKAPDGSWTNQVRLLDEEGNILQTYENIQEVYGRLENDWWHACQDGRIAVKVDGLWGYLDKNGPMVIEPAWEEAQTFSCGLAAVKQDGKWGYIDREGHLAVSFQFDDVVPYAENAARVWSDDGGIMVCSFIDLAGNFIGGAYDFADDYRAGIAAVLEDNEAFLVNARGQRLWNERRPYTVISKYADEYPELWIAYDEEQGQDFFLDRQGKILCPLDVWEDDPDYDAL